jgi:hypothetical protein
MTEKELMKWVLIIAFIGVGILLVRWIRNKIKKNIMDQSKPETEDKEDFLISDMASPSDEDSKGQKTVPIYMVNNAVEAMAIKAMLEENNISSIVTSFEDLAYDGIYQEQKGWGMLQVFENDREKAGELIKGYLEEQAKEIAGLAVSEKAKEPITVFRIVTIILAVGILVIFINMIVFIIIWFIRNIFG